MHKLSFLSSSCLDYQEAQQYMKALVEEVKTHKSPGYIWFLEHFPVITVSSRTSPEDLIAPQIPVIQTNRGGKATYHGPGQRIVYLILPLSLFQNDVRLYIRTLEQWIIDALQTLQIPTFRDTAGVGIWYQDHPRPNSSPQKIAAIGVHVSRGITSHGIAINVHVDPHVFQQIIPCGIKDRGVISLCDIRPNIHMNSLDEALIKTFEQNFGYPLDEKKLFPQS